MTAVIYRLDDYRRTPLSVGCPYCHAEPGRRCTLSPRSPIIRLHGPHPDRTAAAEAALTSEQK